MRSAEIWEFRSASGHVSGIDLAGYYVEAVDSPVGTVDHLSQEDGSAYLVVHTGPWIPGEHLLLPAATVARVEHESQTVFVDRSKAEIDGGPGFTAPGDVVDAACREEHAGYYGRFYDGPAC